jgi:hypothetical protein
MRLSGFQSGNMKGTVPGLSPIAGVEGSGLNNARAGSQEPQPRPAGPSAAQTPEEALTYIELLYKAGRTAELAAILRQNQVFREAWLMLQRSFPAPVEASEPEFNPGAAVSPEGLICLNPACKLTPTPTKVLRAYQSLQSYYEQERNSKLRISLRV